MEGQEERREMEGLFNEIVASEAWVRSEAAALGERVAPLTELSKAALVLRGRLEQVDELLARAAVVAAAEARTVSEADKMRQRLARHEEEVGLLRVELRTLKERVRRNAERFSQQQREQLMALRSGAGEEAGKKTALRSAEAGTAALREAASAMRREAERMQAARQETEEVSDLIREAATQQRELEGELGIGRGLVTRLERRDFTDRMLIGFAVAVFAVVCLYIFKARTVG